jgi:hypothetical protein
VIHVAVTAFDRLTRAQKNGGQTSIQDIPMLYATTLAVLTFLATANSANQDDPKAHALAQDILNNGAALFDNRDSAQLAATFRDDSVITLIKKSSDDDKIVTEKVTGKNDIEKSYADIFKDRDPDHHCRNTVEYAHFLSENLLLIQGRFALNRDQGDSIQFVQVRAREGADWKVVTMQLFELP